MGSSESSLLAEETKPFDKLLLKLDSIGDSIESKLDKKVSNIRQVSTSSRDTTDPEDSHVRELLLSKLAKYRSVKRENKPEL